MKLIISDAAIARTIGTAGCTGRPAFNTFTSILPLEINLEIVARNSSCTHILRIALRASSHGLRAQSTATRTPLKIVAHNTGQAIARGRWLAIITSNAGCLALQTLTTRQVVIFITCHAGLSRITAAINYTVALVEAITQIADSTSILHLSLAGPRNESIALIVL